MSRPTRVNLERQLDEIGSLILNFPTGIGMPVLIEKYAGLSGEQLEARTMLRRLTELTRRRRIEARGAGRATRYYSLSSPEGDAGALSPSIPGVAGSTDEEYVPLSLEGGEVRALVRRPLIVRPPVGYQPDFLERYQPGTSWYLPSHLRAHLHELGRTPAADRPAGTYAREIFEHLLIDLSWASSRLEGNTYSRLDTKELIRYGREAQGKDAQDTQMILNHKAAIELLVEQAEDVGFNRRTFLGLHAILSENLVGDRQGEGRLRTRLVGITGTAFTPLGIPQKIEEHFDLLLHKADQIPDPLEQAFFVMVHLPYLQPFIDVNKRTSRLGANLPLIKANLCPLSFVDVPDVAYVEGTLGVYEFRRIELLRDVFAWAYERSCAQYAVVRENMGKPDPIRLGYREQLREAVREVVQQGALPELAVLEAWAARNGIRMADIEVFVETARADLLDLHEGALHRYRLRVSEFMAWQDRLRGSRVPGSGAVPR